LVAGELKESPDEPVAESYPDSAAVFFDATGNNLAAGACRAAGNTGFLKGPAGDQHG